MSSNSVNLSHIENKTLKSKKDIEFEFKDLKFIHQHEPITNEQTIYTDICLNGSFKDNYIISLVDDLFINFEHTLFIPKNLGDFWKFYEEHKQSANILIDSRCVNYIAYAILQYEDNVIIYDVYTGLCVSVYVFCSKFFNIQTNEITISQIKQLFVAYLLFSVFVKSFDFEWNTLSIIKCIKSNDLKINMLNNVNLNIFDVLIDYCKVKTTCEINTKNIYYIIEQFEIYFSKSAYQSSTAPLDINKEWKIKNIKPYEFLVALTILKNNGFKIEHV